ncbi:MAG: ABC transporter ATP-binding protein, partial [Oscillospiraceae bacterium]
ILVDGGEIRDYTRSSLRGAYAMVLQDTWVFRGTIFENIAYGKENATMDEVVRAAKAAHIHSFIMRLPEGYHTVIGEDGGNISKGQKQLLTIARAMLYDAKMLILDEATSNVDTGTERQVQKAMRELMRGKTCFTIAHRLSTIQNADKILVVDHGDVVEQGTHESLMKQKGFYYKLYAAQFD